MKRGANHKMKELLSLIPGVSDILKVPVIMLAAAFSVAVFVIAVKMLIKLFVKIFHMVFHHKEQA